MRYQSRDQKLSKIIGGNVDIMQRCKQVPVSRSVSFLERHIPNHVSIPSTPQTS